MHIKQAQSERSSRVTQPAGQVKGDPIAACAQEGTMPTFISASSGHTWAAQKGTH